MAYSVHKRFGRTRNDGTRRAGTIRRQNPTFIGPSLSDYEEAPSNSEYSFPLECIIFFTEFMVILLCLEAHEILHKYVHPLSNSGVFTVYKGLG
jgi:hypothetical protein